MSMCLCVREIGSMFYVLCYAPSAILRFAQYDVNTHFPHN